VTISDLVADLRAPTPSAAAELVVPHKREVLTLLREFHGRMNKAMESRIIARRIRVDGLRKSHGIRLCVDLIAQRWQLTDQLGRRLRRGWEKTREGWDGALKIHSQQLIALNPRGVLRRGYSICRRLADRKVVSDARCLHSADAIEVTFARGKIEALVKQVQAKGLAGASRRLEDG
jgi:exodeoxyribonuclease VII large subunit